MGLISVTTESRNGKPLSSSDLISVNKIALPIREVGGKALITLNESILSGRGSENLVLAEYLVTESLATVVASDYSLFTATVLTRGGKVPSAGFSTLGFDIGRIVGPILEDGAGSKFMYHEDNASLPVEFTVSEAPSVILAQTLIPTPVADPVLRYKALLTQSGTNAPVATVLENSLGGVPVWSYDSTGFYIATLNDAFTLNKTFVLISPSLTSDNYILTQLIDVNSIGLFVSLLTNIGGGDNDQLSNTSILIEVYP